MKKEDQKIINKIRKHMEEMYELNDQLSPEVQNIECDGMPWFSMMEGFRQALATAEQNQ